MDLEKQIKKDEPMILRIIGLEIMNENLKRQVELFTKSLQERCHPSPEYICELLTKAQAISAEMEGLGDAKDN